YRALAGARSRLVQCSPRLPALTKRRTRSKLAPQRRAADATTTARRYYDVDGQLTRTVPLEAFGLSPWRVVGAFSSTQKTKAPTDLRQSGQGKREENVQPPTHTRHRRRQ